MGKQTAPKFDLAGELKAAGEWNSTTSLPVDERRAVLVPWIATFQNHVDGPLAEALATITMPPGAAEACELAGVTVPKGA